MLHQRWRDTTFIHWRYEPAALQALLPEGVEIDTFDGAGWLGLTPFVVEGSRPHFAPALPRVSTFPETNLRTYVIGPDGRDGLWFLTLEADSLLTVGAARSVLGIPYRWADMEVSRNSDQLIYDSRRRKSSSLVRHRIVVRPTDVPVAGNVLADWLTGRWRAWTRLAGRFAAVPAQHEPWPLVDAELVDLEENLVDAVGLPQPLEAPIVHFAGMVSVRLGWPQLVSRSEEVKT